MHKIKNTLSKNPAAYIFALYCISRFVILIAILFTYIFKEEKNNIFDTFCINDCRSYLEIAENFYVKSDYNIFVIQTSVSTVKNEEIQGEFSPFQVHKNYAFFPALPILIALSTKLLSLGHETTAVILSQSLALCGMFLFHAFSKIILPENKQRHALWLYAFWPFGIYFSLPMSESLFVPLMLAVFLAVRHGHWGLAALLVIPLSATRSSGFFIVIYLLAEALRQFGWRALLRLEPGTEKAILAFATSGLGLGLYMQYQYYLEGDALAFSHMQSAWWRFFTFPWVTIIEGATPFLSDASRLPSQIMETLIWLCFLVALFKSLRSQLRSECLFLLALLIFPSFTGQTLSLVRFSGVAVPLLVILAERLDTADVIKRARLYALFAFCLWSVATFLRINLTF